MQYKTWSDNTRRGEGCRKDTWYKAKLKAVACSQKASLMTQRCQRKSYCYSLGLCLLVCHMNCWTAQLEGNLSEIGSHMLHACCRRSWMFKKRQEWVWVKTEPYEGIRGLVLHRNNTMPPVDMRFSGGCPPNARESMCLAEGEPSDNDLMRTHRQTIT